MHLTDLLTLALVVITGIYVRASFQILRANREAVQAMHEQTEALLRPYIAVELTGRPGTTLLQLTVRNTGRSAAENLTMSIDRPVFARLDGPPKNLQELPLFSSEEPTVLAAGAELHYLLGLGYKVFSDPPEHRLPDTFVVSARYRSGKREFNELHPVGTRPLAHSAVQPDQVATAIEHAAKKLVQVMGSMSK